MCVCVCVCVQTDTETFRLRSFFHVQNNTETVASEFRVKIVSHTSQLQSPSIAHTVSLSHTSHTHTLTLTHTHSHSHRGREIRPIILCSQNLTHTTNKQHKKFLPLRLVSRLPCHQVVSCLHCISTEPTVPLCSLKHRKFEVFYKNKHRLGSPSSLQFVLDL